VSVSSASIFKTTGTSFFQLSISHLLAEDSCSYRNSLIQLLFSKVASYRTRQTAKKRPNFLLFLQNENLAEAVVLMRYNNKRAFIRHEDEEDETREEEGKI
jgi:hypothetical protein